MSRLFIHALAGAVAGFLAGALTVGGLNFGSPPMPGGKAGDQIEPQASLTADRQDSPVASALAILRHGADLRSYAELGKTLEKLDPAGIAKLLDLLNHDEFGRVDYRAAWLMKWWMKHDPAQAFAWVRVLLDRAAQDGAISLGENHMSTRAEIILAWIKADTKAALDYARAHPGSGIAISIIQQIKPGDVGMDNRTWFDLLQTFPSCTAQRDAVKRMLSNWAGKDGRAAFAAAESIESGPGRDQSLAAVLTKWSEKDATAAFEHYHSSGVRDTRILGQILANAVRKGPDTAFELFGRLDPAAQAHVAPILVVAWAQKEPVKALAWAFESGVGLRGYGTFSTEIAPVRFGRGGTSYTSYVSPIWVALNADTVATVEWMRSLPIGSAGDQLITTALGQAQVSRADALSLFETITPDGKPLAAYSVAGKFGNDSAAFRAWAESLPEDAVRAAAWRGMGSRHPDLLDVPAGPDRDAMIYGRIFGVGIHSGVPSTLDLTLQIQDSTLRRDAFDQAMDIYTNSQGFDSWRAEARAWLESADLPEEWKSPWRQ
jgi:hypothetical protein